MRTLERHVVAFELVPHGEGTKVTLAQANVTAADIERRAEYRKSGSAVLESPAKRFL